MYAVYGNRKKIKNKISGGMGVSALLSGGFETINATAVLRSKSLFPEKNAADFFFSVLRRMMSEYRC